MDRITTVEAAKCTVQLDQQIDRCSVHHLSIAYATEIKVNSIAWLYRDGLAIRWHQLHFYIYIFWIRSGLDCSAWPIVFDIHQLRCARSLIHSCHDQIGIVRELDRHVLFFMNCVHIGGSHDVRSRTSSKALYDVRSYIEKVGEGIKEGRTMGMSVVIIRGPVVYMGGSREFCWEGGIMANAGVRAYMGGGGLGACPSGV